MHPFPGRIAMRDIFRDNLACGKHIDNFIALKTQELVSDLVGLQMTAFNKVHDLFFSYGQNLRCFTDSDVLTAHALTLPEEAH